MEYLEDIVYLYVYEILCFYMKKYNSYFTWKKYNSYYTHCFKISLFINFF